MPRKKKIFRLIMKSKITRKTIIDIILPETKINKTMRMIHKHYRKMSVKVDISPLHSPTLPQQDIPLTDKR